MCQISNSVQALQNTIFRNSNGYIGEKSKQPLDLDAAKQPTMGTSQWYGSLRNGARDERFA